MAFLADMGKPDLKVIWKCKGPKVILRKKNKVEGLIDFKTYHKATVFKTVWDWHNDRHRDQQSRTEGLETNLSIYSQMIFDKGAKNLRKEESFQQMILELLDNQKK